MSPSRVLMLGTDPEMRGGVASVVATLRDAGLFERFQIRYVPTHVDGSAARKLLRFAKAVVTTVRVLASQRISIVHAHVSSNGSFWRKALLLWIARRFRVTTIFHLHDGGFGVFAETGFGGAFLRRCIRRTLEGSDCVIVLSPRWAEWVRGFAPGSRVRVVGNPVRCPSEQVIRAGVRDAPGTARRILFLGKICREKGAFDLLAAFARFHAQDSSWRLVVGGNGDVESFLAAADASGVRPQVDYLGWVSGAAKDEELSKSDIFVLPSYSEGMPVSVLEAMAFGAAVITTPVGGVPDMMVPDVHGLWIDPGDQDALTACLARLASSPPLRARLGAAAREHVVRHFSVEVVMSQIGATYAEAACAPSVQPAE